MSLISKSARVLANHRGNDGGRKRGVCRFRAERDIQIQMVAGYQDVFERKLVAEVLQPSEFASPALQFRIDSPGGISPPSKFTGSPSFRSSQRNRGRWAMNHSAQVRVKARGTQCVPESIPRRSLMLD